MLGDASQLLRANQQVSASLGGLEGTFAKVGQVAAGFLSAQLLAGAGQRVMAFVGDSVKAASSLGESVNAVQQIFGDAAPEILKWGESNATSFGLSQRAFNEMATPMGAVLKNLGFEQDEVADSTVNLTKRAADMASVFNTDVEDALAAINSALRGEANPIERYGVSVNQATVNLRALADTGKTSATALTENEKAAARLAIIFEQTSAVAGDFANTSDGLANSQRITAAETEKMQAEIGEKLLPVMLMWTQAKLKLLDALVLVIPVVDVFTRGIGLLADNAEIVAGVLVGVSTALLISAIPAMVTFIATTWATVAALTAQAIAMAIANPLLAAAGIAAGVAMVAYIKLNVATEDTSAAAQAAAWDVQNLGAEMEEAASAAWAATSSLDAAADSADGLSAEAVALAAELRKVTSSSLAASYATSLYSAELAGAEAASADAYTAAVNHIRGVLAEEEALSGLTDSLLKSAGWTDRYTESTDRSDSSTRNATASTRGATAASKEASDALREQADALEEVNRIMEDAARRSDSLAGSFARLGDKARADAAAAAADVARQLRGGGVSPEDAARIGAEAGKLDAVGGVPRRAYDLVVAALQAGTIDTTTANRLFRAAVSGTPDPLMLELGLVPGLASGGIVRARRGGTLALLGEGGQDEAVVPLGRGRGVGTTVININVTAGVGDPDAIGRQIAQYLNRAALGNGPLLSSRVVQ
jgi:hypothetical protein